VSAVLELDLDARWFAGKGRHVSDVAIAAAAGPLSVADVRYADGGAERYLLVDDEPSVWAPVLAAPPAPLRLIPGPFPLPDAAALDGDAFVPSTDQTNTLAVLGGTLLVKAYRRLESGVHPEVEVLRALAGTGAPVPGFAGALELGDTVIALLQEFVPGAEAGWETPIEAAAAHLRAGAGPAPAADLEAFAAAGRAAAELHAALAATLPGAVATGADVAAWRAEAEAALDVAAGLDPEAAAMADAVRAELAVLDRVAPPPLSRIHGDLHYAQFLRAPGRLAIVDFEGDPTRPLAARRALDTPLRDLAALLRSIDHIGRAASRRADWAAPDAWIAAVRAAALDAYEAAAPVEVDLRLLRALEVAKECTELVYAARVLPEWAYAPRLGLRHLLEVQTP
jgi:maltokinase